MEKRKTQLQLNEYIFMYNGFARGVVLISGTHR